MAGEDLLEAGEVTWRVVRGPTVVEGTEHPLDRGPLELLDRHRVDRLAGDALLGLDEHARPLVRRTALYDGNRRGPRAVRRQEGHGGSRDLQGAGGEHAPRIGGCSDAQIALERDE